MKFWKFVSMAVALTLSVNANAAVISVDWQSVGDNLITRDTVSGLDWLDLTQTNGMSYNMVSSQLGTDGQFNGFRYATSAEVVALWANFGVDLTWGSPTTISGPADSGLTVATTYLGNIIHEYDPAGYDYGALGIARNLGGEREPHSLYRMGAYHDPSVDVNYYNTEFMFYASETQESGYIGSYLVQSVVVPVPAAMWLFCSGLLGLYGVARRKLSV